KVMVHTMVVSRFLHCYLPLTKQRGLLWATSTVYKTCYGDVWHPAACLWSLRSQRHAAGARSCSSKSERTYATVSPDMVILHKNPYLCAVLFFAVTPASQPAEQQTKTKAKKHQRFMKIKNPIDYGGALIISNHQSDASVCPGKYCCI